MPIKQLCRGPLDWPSDDGSDSGKLPNAFGNSVKGGVICKRKSNPVRVISPPEDGQITSAPLAGMQVFAFFPMTFFVS